MKAYIDLLGSRVVNLLAIRVIWRNGNISAGVGILERLPGNACLL